MSEAYAGKFNSQSLAFLEFAFVMQPRICSKLWEALRKSLKESYKMELEFFD